MQNKIEIPPALARIAGDRDHISTREFADYTDHADQTIRKNYCTTGHCFGIVPRKIGNFLQWPVNETAALYQGVQK